MDYFKSKKFLLNFIFTTFLIVVVIITSISLLYLIYYSVYKKPVYQSYNYEWMVETDINEQPIILEIVTADEEQYLGLSNRTSLCDNCGMLFLFNYPEEKSFVMRNMNFPLDIIFIDSNDTIVKIYENLPPEGAMPQRIYNSEVPVIKVMELNAGMSKKLKLQEGDIVDFLDSGLLRVKVK